MELLSPGHCSVRGEVVEHQLGVQPGLVGLSCAEAPDRDQLQCAWGSIEGIKSDPPYCGRFDQTCLYAAL